MKSTDLPLPWQICLEETWKACCAGSIPIGAVVTNSDGTIIGRGRSHRYDSDSPPGHIKDHKLAHAELNALLDVRLPDKDLKNCELFTAVEPCPLCISAIYMASLKSYHYASRDPYAGSSNLLKTTPYLSRKPVQSNGPQWTELENVLMALQVDFFLRRGESPDYIVLTTWRNVLPEGFAYGKVLFQDKVITNLCISGKSSAAVFDQLFTGFRELNPQA